MATSDQMKKFIGKKVRVETTDGTFTGRMEEVKSSTIWIRDPDNTRTLIRIAQIIAIAEILAL